MTIESNPDEKDIDKNPLEQALGTYKIPSEVDGSILIQEIIQYFKNKIQPILSRVDTVISSKYGKTIPAIVLAVSAGVSIQAYTFEKDQLEKNLEAQLKAQLSEIIVPIENKIQAYQQLLYGVRGFINASPKDSLNRKGFHNFIQEMNLGNLPEVQGISISYIISNKELPEYIQKMKEDGFTGLKIGSTNNSQYAPVTYIESFIGNNIDVLGFDNFSDELFRKKAMIDAQRLNTGILTPSVPLKQEGNNISSGFLMYLPIYKKGTPQETENERNTNIEGWVSIAFDASKILGNRFKGLDIKIYDESNKDIPIYSLHNASTDSATHLVSKRTVNIANRHWQFIITSTQEFEHVLHHEEYLHNIIITGSIISFLLAFFIHFLITKRIDSLVALDQMEVLGTNLLESETRYKKLFTESNVTMLIIDPDNGTILDANDCASQYYGYSNKEIIGMHISKINLLPFDEVSNKLTSIRTREKEKFEIQHTLANGDIRDVNVSTSYIQLRGKDIVLSIIEDTTERIKAIEKVRNLVSHDTLTGLPNKNLFLSMLKSACSQADRYGHSVAHMYLDIDNFKAINDSIGHDTGDKLLKIVVSCIKKCIREEDVVGRQGGDEFLIFAGNLKKPEEAAMLAEKILKSIKGPFYIDDHEFNISGSIGISMYPRDSKEIPSLIRYSDSTMYRVKASGKNGYQFFSQEMHESLVRRQKIENMLHHALERNEISTNFQPVVNTETGNISSMEALIRWNNADLGFISPAEFIPIAEDNGLIIPIGEWVIRDVCNKIKEWQGEGILVPRIAINLSVGQFHKATLYTDIVRILEEMGVESAMIGLEITESMLFRDVEGAAKTIKKLSDFGFELSIDDFGSGYSSLSYLRDFDVKKLKIDKSFIDKLEITGDERIIQGIIALSHSLGLLVIAEGVETKNQYERLKSLGCDFIQGYYFGKPENSVKTTLLLMQKMYCYL